MIFVFLFDLLTASPGNVFILLFGGKNARFAQCREAKNNRGGQNAWGKGTVAIETNQVHTYK